MAGNRPKSPTFGYFWCIFLGFEAQKRRQNGRFRTLSSEFATASAASMKRWSGIFAASQHTAAKDMPGKMKKLFTCAAPYKSGLNLSKTPQKRVKHLQNHRKIAWKCMKIIEHHRQTAENHINDHKSLNHHKSIH